MIVALRLIVLGLGAIMLTFYLIIAFLIATAHAAGPTPSEWYRSLIQPGTGASCCDISDCRPARATFDGSHWWVDSPTGRLVVPPELILEGKEPLDGMSAYVCIWGGQVRCFVKPGSGG